MLVHQRKALFVILRVTCVAASFAQGASECPAVEELCLALRAEGVRCALKELTCCF